MRVQSPPKSGKGNFFYTSRMAHYRAPDRLRIRQCVPWVRTFYLAPEERPVPFPRKDRAPSYQRAGERFSQECPAKSDDAGSDDCKRFLRHDFLPLSARQTTMSVCRDLLQPDALSPSTETTPQASSPTNTSSTERPTSRIAMTLPRVSMTGGLSMLAIFLQFRMNT